MASRLEAYARSVIDEPGRSGPVADVLRGFLGGCAGLYDISLEAYLRAERLGLRRRARLPISVISVGNLTVGGTGKTPLAQWLCRGLVSGGRRVAVLSRGHGGTGTGVCVVSDQEGAVFVTSEEAGDEPTLLARTLPGVPVLVGKDRRLSGREALRRFALDALVLDDGFQYWQLARDLDIVLLDARRPFDNGHPLPRGLLREPKRHLARAGVVIVTRADCLDGAGREQLRARIARLAPGVSVFFARHRPVGLVPVADLAAEPLSLSWLCGKSVVALSGIAQPQSFHDALTGAGAGIARALTFEDHARYTPAEAEAARRAVAECGAEALIMTEKDAVKWPTLKEQDMPVYALRIEMQVEDEERFWAELTARVFGSRR